MLFRRITDANLAQNAYLIGCQRTGQALVIDPERDIDRYIEMAAEEGLRITAVTETHIHADFLSGTREFADRHGVRVYLSDEGGEGWRYTWPALGEYDVVLLRDGDAFMVGNIRVEARHTPGHTPEHLSFLITDTGGGADAPMGIVTGDFVFVGDLGRPDLLETAAGHVGAREPAARTLYESVQEFMGLEDYLLLWPGHGAGSACGKALGAVPESTVGYEKRFNRAVDAARRGRDIFVENILEGQPEPPVYFARMKRLNRDGPPLLGELPRPRELSTEELGALAGRADVVVVDTREDRSEFMRAHLPGSLLASLGRDFPTVVGSYVEPGTPIVPIVERSRVEDVVRELIRVGLDDVAAFATPDTLRAYAAAGGRMDTIEEISTVELEQRRHARDAIPLDVRRLDEYREGHVPGAVLAPHVRLLELLDEVPRDGTLLVYCRSGNRSAAAAAFLQRHGRDVVYVNGLFPEWEKANPDVVVRGVVAAAHA